MFRKTFLIIGVIALLAMNTFSIGEINAATHELEELDIHVFINEDGSAFITEKRVATLSEGTENYIIIGNLGKSTITNFTVYEDGQLYESVENWDVDWTREQKTFKNGMIEEKDHYELVWGIGEYGEHEYELSYTVTDFIKQLDDSQMMFWQFVNSNTNIPPQNVTVTIETNEPLSDENERIWAFGFEGDIHFEDGKIVAKNNQPLDKSDYVTILTKFLNSHFGTNDILDQTFDEIKEQAFEGSDYNEGYSFLEILMRVLAVFFLVMGFFLLISFLMDKHADRKKRKLYEGRYYREIPFDGEPYMAYLLLLGLDLSNLNHLLSAVILKWISEDRLRVVRTTKKGFMRVKEINELHIADNGAEGLTENQAELFHFFVSASVDGVIKEKEFKKWSRKNYKPISKWERKLIDLSIKELDEKGFVESEEVEVNGETYTRTPNTAKGKAFQDNIYMFMNYLKDYSLLNEHEPVNVKLWDDLMIWASLLGITEEVYDQFKALYPEYEQQSRYSDTTITTATAYSRRIYQSVHSARSSGFGGSSSSGGGGGSFGGGSGGGTR